MCAQKYEKRVRNKNFQPKKYMEMEQSKSKQGEIKVLETTLRIKSPKGYRPRQKTVRLLVVGVGASIKEMESASRRHCESLVREVESQDPDLRLAYEMHHRHINHLSGIVWLDNDGKAVEPDK